MKFEQREDRIECFGHNNDSGLTTYSGDIYLSHAGFYMFDADIQPLSWNDLKSIAAKVNELNMEISK